MIRFTVNGYPYTLLSMTLRLKYPNSENVKGFLKECSEVISASFLEKVPEEYGVEQSECSICGASLEGQSHASATGCDDCVEASLTHCSCCSMEHDFYYLAEKYNIILEEVYSDGR